MFARDPEFEVLDEAAEGAEAVTLAQALEPNVILMDLRMPGMDGLTAITELASRGVPARILVLTTYETDSDVLPAIEAGVRGDQPGGRRPAVHHRGHGLDPPAEHLRQTRRR